MSKYKRFLFTINFLASFFFIFGCNSAQTNAGSNDDIRPDEIYSGSIPQIMIQHANQFVISKVGEDFFNRYLRIDSNRSQSYPADSSCMNQPNSCPEYLKQPHFLIAYSFKIPGKTWIDEMIFIPEDNEGNVVLVGELYGLPNCVQLPDDCNFPIDESRAISIARESGLQDGIRAWQTDFYWYAREFKTYIWSITNTSSFSTNPLSGSGQTIIVDANSGQVLTTLSWSLIE